MTNLPGAHSRRAVLAAGAAAGAAAALPARADELPWTLPPLRTMLVDGQSISYFEAGSGSPLVLAHGMSGSAAFEWGRVIGPLSRRHRVIAPYQIGFAPSAQPDLPYDATTFVDYLGGLMQHLGLDRPALAGESFGGWVAAHYALRQGGRTRWGLPLPTLSKLVIVDGAVHVHVTPGGGPQKQSINDPEVAKTAGAFYLSQPKVDNSLVSGRVTGGVIYKEAVPAAALSTVRTPTLVVWGEQDQLIPLADGRQIAAEIPHARLAVIPECGHIPSVERPEAFLAALKTFGLG